MLQVLHHSRGFLNLWTCRITRSETELQLF